MSASCEPERTCERCGGTGTVFVCCEGAALTPLPCRSCCNAEGYQESLKTWRVGETVLAATLLFLIAAILLTAAGS